MKRHILHKRILSLVLLTMFLLSALFPFVSSYQSNGISLASSGGKVLICTIEGFKWLSIEEVQEEQKTPGSIKVKCPLCNVASSDPEDMMLSEGDVHYSSLVGKWVYFSAHDYFYDEEYTAHHALDRAPPFSIHA